MDLSTATSEAPLEAAGEEWRVQKRERRGKL